MGACRRRAALVLLALAVLGTTPGTGAAEVTIPSTEVMVRVKPVPRFGAADGSGPLTFLGGLELQSGNRHLGGLSGLVVGEDGARIHAITDNAIWVEATLVSDEGGRPLTVRDARIAPMLGPDGTPLLDLGRGDTEALTLRLNGDGRTGELLATTERVHEIYAFPWPFDPTARGRLVALPDFVTGLRHNKGMETIAAVDEGPLAGSLVVIGERGPDDEADMPGFLIGGPSPGRFSVIRDASYDATDLAMLPGGDLLLLERRFTLRHGIGMRLRLLPAAEIVPGGRAGGTVLLEAGFADQIDNMEGLAVHRGPGGETIVTLLSDDNRSILQRTLLLRFRLDLP